jgi:hypothetical protein
MSISQPGLLSAAEALKVHATVLRHAAERVDDAASELSRTRTELAVSWISPESLRFQDRVTAVSEPLRTSAPDVGSSSGMTAQLADSAESLSARIGALDHELADLESQRAAMVNAPRDACDPPPDTSGLDSRISSNRSSRGVAEKEWLDACARAATHFNGVAEALDSARIRIDVDGIAGGPDQWCVSPRDGGVPSLPPSTTTFAELLRDLLQSAKAVAKAYIKLWKKLGLGLRTVSPSVNLLFKLAPFFRALLIVDGVRELFGGAWKDSDADIVDRIASGLIVLAGALAVVSIVFPPAAVAALVAASVISLTATLLRHRELLARWGQVIWNAAERATERLSELLEVLPVGPFVLSDDLLKLLREGAEAVWDWGSELWRSRWDLLRSLWDGALRLLDRGLALALSAIKLALVIQMLRLLPLSRVVVAIAVLGMAYLAADELARLLTPTTTPMNPEDHANNLRKNLELIIDPEMRALAELAARLGGLDERDVRALAATLSTGELERLIEDYPEIVGNLDGMPTWVRTSANLRLLKDDELAAIKSGDRARVTQLRNLRKSIEDDDVGLYTYRSDYPDRYVLVIGDPDTACRIGVLVPGTLSDATKSTEYFSDARLLHDDVSKAVSEANSCGAATFVYNDYDTPRWWPPGGLPTDPTAAEDAAPGLAGFMETRFARNPEAHMTLIGHSYGGTVVGAMLDQPVDLPTEQMSVVLLATPGIGVDRLDDLHMVRDGIPPIHVATHPRDPIRIAQSGPLGSVRLGPGPDSLVGVIHMNVPESAWTGDALSAHDLSNYQEVIGGTLSDIVSRGGVSVTGVLA